MCCWHPHPFNPSAYLQYQYNNTTHNVNTIPYHHPAAGGRRRTALSAPGNTRASSRHLYVSLSVSVSLYGSASVSLSLSLPPSPFLFSLPLSLLSLFLFLSCTLHCTHLWAVTPVMRLSVRSRLVVLVLVLVMSLCGSAVVYDAMRRFVCFQRRRYLLLPLVFSTNVPVAPPPHCFRLCMMRHRRHRLFTVFLWCQRRRSLDTIDFR
jgi:hypothetical protein